MYLNYLILTFLCNVFYVWCYTNATANFTDNNLWLTIVNNCEDKPSTDCLKDSIHGYLKETLEYQGDIQLMDFVKFTKNSVAYKKLNQSEDESLNNRNGSVETDVDRSPLEEISRSLKDDTRKFLMTHDLQVQLPETFFLGSALKISPRSLDSSGVELKFEVIPKRLDNAVGEGRTIKKIKEFISERLAWALLAILLVIKLLAVKVLFILPTLLGVAAAKKLILKVLLFLFPFLHHLFKLCAYTPYGAKHHIHKHQISHIHEVAHGHHKPHYPHPHGVEVIAPHAEGPPHYYSKHGKKDGFDPYEEPYPAHASAYADEILHRNDAVDDENEIDPWGQGPSTRRPKPPTSSRPLTPTEIENMVLKAEKEALIKSRLQKERLKIQEENFRLQEQLNNALRVQDKLKKQAALVNKIQPNLGLKPPYSNAALLPTLSPPPASFNPPPIPSQGQLPVSLKISPQFNPQMSLQPSIQLVPQITHNISPNQISPQFSSQLSPQFSNQIQPQFSKQISHQFTPNLSQQLSNHITSEADPRIDRKVSNEDVRSEMVGTSTKVQQPSIAAQIALDYIKQKEIAKNKQQQIQPVYNGNNAENTFSSKADVGTVKILNAAELQNSIPSYSKPTASKKSGLEEQIFKAASITYDPFYSPILEKIDKILNELDFTEEPCRERLVCSMYKNPTKFSPHSNLLSAELSRDSKDLQKPKTTNSAVVRFYRYVQAARDGQDQRDCLRLYPACVINTEA